MEHTRTQTIRDQLAEVNKMLESCHKLQSLGFTVSSMIVKRLQAHRSYLKVELAYYESQQTMFGGM